MKRILRELILAAATLTLAAGQTPDTPAQTETAPKPEANTMPVRIGAGVLLVVIVGIIVLRRKGKKKTDDEF